MSIKTASSSQHDASCKPQRTFDDIILRPGDDVESRLITVDEPIHIFGAMPRDHTIMVYRVYQGVNNECNDIPDLPVPCATNVLTFDGTDMVSDMWLSYKGSYRFILVNLVGGQPTEVPSDMYLWFIKDTAIEGCCNGC